MKIQNISLNKATYILVMAASLSPVCAEAAEFSFVGSRHEVIRLEADRNTGLESIFVAYDTSEITQMRVAVSGSVNISRYSNLGGGYAEPVSFHMDGDVAVIDNPEGDKGYIVEENGRNTCVWLVNYLPQMLTLNSAAGVPQQDCDNTRLEVTGSGDPIHYFSIDGRMCELSRDIEVAYQTLEWSADTEEYLQKNEVKTLSHLTPTVTVTPPIYCNTLFEFSGDRFLKKWGMEKHLQSELVYANGVTAETKAEQTNAPGDDPEADPSNMVKTEIAGIGGSAPVDMLFTAWVTDAVIHSEWQIARDEQFENIDYRFNEQNLEYSFTEEGNYYVRFVGSNADGTCETYGETYTIGVGSSELRIPNAFTPNDDGINDVWKVGYRSLLKFNCTIFDRYGNQLYHFTDPTSGWDGKYNGKLVKPGVYFYVIEAKGADGKSYKKGGDINLIRKRKDSGSGGTVPSDPVE